MLSLPVRYTIQIIKLAGDYSFFFILQ